VASLEETVNRILAILELIAENPGLNITEVARRLGLNRNTVQNNIEVLVKLGLVKKRVTGMPRQAILEPTEKGLCVVKCIKS